MDLVFIQPLFLQVNPIGLGRWMHGRGSCTLPPPWPAPAAVLRSASCSCNTGLPLHGSTAASSPEPPAVPSEPSTPSLSLHFSAPFGPARNSVQLGFCWFPVNKPLIGPYLLQLLLCVPLPVPPALGSLAQLSQASSFLFCRADLVPQLLLHPDLLHLNAALLLLSPLQPGTKQQDSVKARRYLLSSNGPVIKGQTGENVRKVVPAESALWSGSTLLMGRRNKLLHVSQETLT